MTERTPEMTAAKAYVATSVWSVDCAHCETDIELDTIAQEFECVACKERQPLSPEGLKTVLKMAYGLAKNGGRDSKKSYKIHFTAERAWDCPSCGAKDRLETTEAPDGTSLRCSACSKSEPLTRVTALSELVPALIGFIADQDRKGGVQARRETQGSVEVISCPNCGGALAEPPSDKGYVTCSFCKTLCRVCNPVNQAEQPRPPIRLVFRAEPEVLKQKPAPTNKGPGAKMTRERAAKPDERSPALRNWMIGAAVLTLVGTLIWIFAIKH
jgi:hypothetical protein